MFRSDRRDRLSQIFSDTRQRYETDPVLSASCRHSVLAQTFCREGQSINVDNALMDRYGDEVQIVVSSKRTLEAASVYTRDGMSVAVHNFASSFNPGGGVKHGASAQEECLCRCSTLYYSLNSRQAWANFYNPHRSGNLNCLHNDDIIYTPDVKVFKSDIDFPEILPVQQWYDVNVITCAAPDLHSSREEGVTVSDEQLAQIHKRRLIRILDTALSNGCEAVILGAFGCGAFGNPPKLAAIAAKEAVSRYRHSFKVIEFAVYCTPKSMDNYNSFKSIIS